MKRREFIVNSLLAIGGAVLLDGCNLGGNKTKKNAGNKVVTRKFKNLDIPLLSFGCMRLPVLNGQVDIDHFEKMADYAMRRGVNYFDTAYMYHGGESENAVGRILSTYKRDSFILATKNPLRALNSKEDIRRIFDEQLKKCRVDYFDFYMAHNLSVLTADNYRNFKVYDELMKIKEEGLIKHVGFSYHGGDELLREAANEYPWEFCQIQFNYLDWKDMHERRGMDSPWSARNVYKNYDILVKAKIPIIAMSPLRGGALSRLAGSAKAVVADQAPNDTPTSLALRWCAGKENVFTVLSGMSSLEQMKENVETFINYRPITEKEEAIAEKVAAILQKQGEINCTTCNYCADCPRGIAIAFIFDAYNEYKATGKAEVFIKKYDSLKEREKADKCIKCGLCSQHCPQLLDIPPLLEMVDNTIKKLKNTAV